MIVTNLNNKGGVGKTTNTIHLGAALVDRGYKVLFIDCDSQCDLTYAVGAEEATYTIEEFLQGDPQKAHENFQLTAIDENFFILAGNSNFYAGYYPADALQKALNNPHYQLKERFDFIFIDVPPERIHPKVVSPMEMALTCADYFIVPIEAQDFSIKNLNLFINKALDIRKSNPNLKFLGFYFTNVHTITKMFKDYYTMMRTEYENICFKNYIRRDAEVVQATSARMTIFEYNPKSRASQDYQRFVDEFITRLNLK